MSDGKESESIGTELPTRVVQRGHNRQAVFVEDEDVDYYLENLREWKDELEIKLYGWCLMTNHIHLIPSSSNKCNTHLKIKGDAMNLPSLTYTLNRSIEKPSISSGYIRYTRLRTHLQLSTLRKHRKLGLQCLFAPVVFSSPSTASAFSLSNRFGYRSRVSLIPSVVHAIRMLTPS